MSGPTVLALISIMFLLRGLASPESIFKPMKKVLHEFQRGPTLNLRWLRGEVGESKAKSRIFSSHTHRVSPYFWDQMLTVLPKVCLWLQAHSDLSSVEFASLETWKRVLSPGSKFQY